MPREEGMKQGTTQAVGLGLTWLTQVSWHLNVASACDSKQNIGGGTGGGTLGALLGEGRFATAAGAAGGIKVESVLAPIGRAVAAAAAARAR